MRTTELGKTGVEISRVGLGAWAMGGGEWAYGWGQQDDADSVATIHRGVELGINWIDTAPIYGLGHSEVVVARAVRDLAPSERPLVFTKCSRVWTARGKIRHSLKTESIQRELEASLRRLGVETIDLYQIHWPCYPADGPAPDIEEGWETLVRLRDQGKIRLIGVSNFNVPQLDRVRAIASVDALQPAYSLIRREIEQELLPYCLAHEIGTIVYSPMGSGLLSGAMSRERIAALPVDDWRKTKSLDFQEPRLSEHLRLGERLDALARRCGTTTAVLAVAWTLRHPAVSGAIVGARRPEQIDGFIGASELEVDEDNWAALSPTE